MFRRTRWRKEFLRHTVENLLILGGRKAIFQPMKKKYQASPELVESFQKIRKENPQDFDHKTHGPWLDRELRKNSPTPPPATWEK